jgi:CMP-N,N'-diacetyllegionaminic acid synthase
MINHKTVLAIIPARGGSKGLPRKNILPVKDTPLIAWTITEAQKSKYIDHLILSSEDEEIIDVAKKWGCDVPFVRPQTLATDDASTMDVVFHTLETIEETYDYIVLLQPTSPRRQVIDIDKCLEICTSQNVPACVSMTETAKSPYWMYQLNDDCQIKPIISDDEFASRRQDLPKTYALNGAVYVAEWPWLLKNKTFLTKETTAYIMPKERSIDIDTKLDFTIFKAIVEDYDLTYR